MKQLINIKELCKRIKHDGKYGRMFWAKEERGHFIISGHYLVRFDELPRDVLVTLFGIFLRLPEMGKTLGFMRGDVISNIETVDYKKIYQPEKQRVKGEVTSLIHDAGDKRIYRVVKFPDRFSFINEDYQKLLVDGHRAAVNGDAPFSPLYFANNDLMIMPMRMTSDNQDISDLLEMLDSPDLVGKEKANGAG
ncbi:hypothetical protein [Paenibacillus sp. MBLB4367]|uniref:hypothetical protein n=1 Tax=Paenibacillus sp. MBLB4367 TaxID=3384767 RepID=UPI0039082A52